MTVKVSEIRAIPYKDGDTPRRWFHVYFDSPYARRVVVAGGMLPAGHLLCDEHGINGDCECGAEVQGFIARYPDATV